MIVTVKYALASMVLYYHCPCISNEKSYNYMKNLQFSRNFQIEHLGAVMSHSFMIIFCIHSLDYEAMYRVYNITMWPETCYII